MPQDQVIESEGRLNSTERRFLRLFKFVTICLFAAIFFYHLIVTPTIQAAYEGRSLPWLNNLISNPDGGPVDYYHNKAYQLFLHAIGWIFLGSLVCLLIGFRHRIAGSSLNRPIATSKQSSSHLPVIDSLRGIASFWVLWFHLIIASKVLPEAHFLSLTAKYGSLGVQIFFVISGFVVPWSLWQRGYQIHNYGKYLLGRIIRLDPPYLASILLVLLLNQYTLISPLPTGKAYIPVEGKQLLLHLAYLNAWFGYDWLNPVFWTLAVEFQFYILMGLLFPLFSSSRWGGSFRIIALVLFTILFSFPLFHFSLFPYFALGIATFFLRAGFIHRPGYFLLISAGLTAIYMKTGWPGTLAAGFACLSIAFLKDLRFPSLKFLGTISYSLYLVHTPVGRRIIAFGMQYCETEWARIALVMLGTAASILVAWIFYWLIEKPALRWSSKVKYRNA